jgi:hypothetical protein
VPRDARLGAWAGWAFWLAAVLVTIVVATSITLISLLNLIADSVGVNRAAALLRAVISRQFPMHRVCETWHRIGQ